MNVDLQVLQTTIQSCNMCDLRKNTPIPCWDSGNVNSKIMFVGEAEGTEEAQVGIPFVGRCGKYLNRCMLAIGLKRSDIFVSNIVMCRPVNTKTNSDRAPTDVEISYCSHYLVRQIELIKPNLLVALGKTSFKFLTDSSDTIFAAKGNLYNYKNDSTVKVFPLLHPSYLISYSSPTILLENWDDWLKLKEKIDEYNI